MSDYWKNRKEGKRGQGEVPILEKIDPYKSKLGSTRKRDRQKVNEPQYTKKRYLKIRRYTREKILRIEEIRHLHSLRRRGEL